MVYTAAQRLDRLPEASFHRRLAAIIGAGLWFDSLDIYIAGSVMVAVTSSGWASVQSTAWFASAGAVGSLVGAFLAGVLGDRFGRRFTFQFNLVLFGVTSLLSAVAPSMVWLIPLRFVMGFALGGESVISYTTISEFVPPATRGKWVSIMLFISTTSLPAANLLGYLLVPTVGWRWLFVIAGVGGIGVWFVRRRMPESPRWLDSVGRTTESREIMDRIEADVRRTSGRELPTPTVVAEPPATGRYRFSDLFRLPLLRSTVIGMTLNIVTLTSLYGFIIWLPTFLVKQGHSLNSSLGYATLTSVGSLIGVAASGWWSDKWSRKQSVVATSVIAAITGYAYAQVGDVVLTTVIGGVFIAMLYFMSGLGYCAYVPELFPTGIRLRGAGVSSMAGRTASIAAPQAVIALFAFNGVAGVTLTLVAMLAVQAVIVATLGFETTSRPIGSQFAGKTSPALAPDATAVTVE